ncbi:hypothetical protein GCM10023238_32520 [Streptomyces heliomycini]
MASYIQHTKIDPDATRDEMNAHAREAVTTLQTRDGARLLAARRGRRTRGHRSRGRHRPRLPTVGVMTSAGKAAEAAEIAPARRGPARHRRPGRLAQERPLRRHFREDIAGVVRACGLPVKVC